jgi:hypothetical protein
MRFYLLGIITICCTCIWPPAALTAAGGPPEPRLASGDLLPLLKGDYLTGKKAVLPEGARGKVALLALGFTYDSRFAVEEWCKRFEERFAGIPDLTFFEVPVIGGAARLARWFIDSGMRKGTPKEKHENVITVYGGVDPWKRRVGFMRPDDAYLILIDRKGVVRWLHSGPFNEEEFARLVSAATELVPAAR